MSAEQNPNNYDGATVTVVGRVGGEAKFPGYDKEGTKGILELSVAVSQGYKGKDGWVDTGTVWYNVTAAGDYAEPLKAAKKGDKVRIDDAKLEAREFDRKDGTKGQAFNLSYGTFVIVEAKADSGSGDGFASDDSSGGF